MISPQSQLLFRRIYQDTNIFFPSYKFHQIKFTTQRMTLFDLNTQDDIDEYFCTIIVNQKI